MERLNDENLELLILGDFWRARDCADRLPDDILACESLNYDTGLPDSANDILAPHAVRLSGESLVRDAFWSPDQLAKAHIRRPCGTCDTCRGGSLERCENGALLSRIHTRLWTKEECKDFVELRNRIQSLFRRWEIQGLIDRTPPYLWTGNETHERARKNKDTWAARLTTEGIEMAEARVPGTPYANGPKSLLWAMTDAQRRAAPQWAQKEFVEEGGRIDGSGLILPGA